MDQSSVGDAVMNPQAGCISNNIPDGEFSRQLGILALGAVFDVCLLVTARLSRMHLLCLAWYMLTCWQATILSKDIFGIIGICCHYLMKLLLMSFI